MNDRVDWRGRLAGPALVLLLAAAILVGPVDALRLAAPDGGPAGDVAGVLDELPDDAPVLVGFDPDIGTYAEVRPTVRALLADLFDRGARRGFFRLTPEGRALSLAEIARLGRSGVDATRVADIGFVPGAEAGVVRLAHAASGGTATGLGAVVADAFDEPPALALIVGGNDLGPRTWVEQFAPRVVDVALVAVAPTVLLPEVRPYLASGQLDALLGTPRDGAAYRGTLDVGRAEAAVAEADVPTALALLLGMLAAIAWLAWAFVGRLSGAIRGASGELE